MVKEIASPADKMQLLWYGELSEDIPPPKKKTYCVNIIDVFLALIHLSLHPVPIQVPEQMVDIFSSGGVPIPFPDVEGEKCLICMGSRILILNLNKNQNVAKGDLEAHIFKSSKVSTQVSD